MKIQIKNRWSLEVIFECKADNIKVAVKMAIGSGANLSGADLHGADLRGADLSGADIREADLREADLREADLREADLRGANLHGADLREADLREADLRGANLSGADLHGADLRGADLSGADIRGADLIVIQLPFYTAYVQKTHTRIGCKYHSNDKWKSFSDKEISKMDSNALEFWNTYKTVIFSAIDSIKG